MKPWIRWTLALCLLLAPTVSAAAQDHEVARWSPVDVAKVWIVNALDSFTDWIGDPIEAEARSSSDDVAPPPPEANEPPGDDQEFGPGLEPMG